MNPVISRLLILLSVIWSTSCSRGPYGFGSKVTARGTAYNGGSSFNPETITPFEAIEGTRWDPTRGSSSGRNSNYDPFHSFHSNMMGSNGDRTYGIGGGGGGGGRIFDVVNFGAVGHGVTDDSQAFLRAWGAACGAPGGNPTLVVPKGRTFLLNPLNFEGPCKSPVLVQILGNLVAPLSVGAWKGSDINSWVKFSDVNGLTIDGANSGQLDGRGAVWWKQCNTQECVRPVGLRFHGITNLQLKGLKHINSAKGHIALTDCKFVAVSGLTILAPPESPNTDGIDISATSHVSIQSLFIATGDDCVAMNGGTTFVNISNVVCGPGHGISVGSLGGNGNVDIVEEIRVRDSILHETQNGVRIKTWQGGEGFARRISFTNLRLDNVENPIIIDQHYCGGGHDCKPKSPGSTVMISDVTFLNIKGTSASREAIRLQCDEKKGCSRVVLSKIDIAPVVPRQQVLAVCSNVQGRAFQVEPPVPCLAKTFA